MVAAEFRMMFEGHPDRYVEEEVESRKNGRLEVGPGQHPFGTIALVIQVQRVTLEHKHYKGKGLVRERTSRLTLRPVKACLSTFITSLFPFNLNFPVTSFAALYTTSSNGSISSDDFSPL